ncbi:MAG: hypothetical protein JWP01_323 [Myxococcales bacterium]|nr:hypothetical protein [Myxococcales bacterium]
MQTIDGHGWFSTDDFGLIDRLETESVVTSFYKVVIPIWPEHSAYVIRASDGSERRIPIRLQPRSVILGYLRVPTWLGALILALPSIMLPHQWGALIVPALLLAILASVLTFFAGRLTAAEQLRRQLLRRVVGFGAPPELLTEGMRLEMCSNLELMWNTRSPNIRWIDAIEQGEPSELLIALAEYHQDPELLELAHANSDNKLWN